VNAYQDAGLTVTVISDPGYDVARNGKNFYRASGGRMEGDLMIGDAGGAPGARPGIGLPGEIE